MKLDRASIAVDSVLTTVAKVELLSGEDAERFIRDMHDRIDEDTIEGAIYRAFVTLLLTLDKEEETR
jgi:hypothetical protein